MPTQSELSSGVCFRWIRELRWDRPRFMYEHWSKLEKAIFEFWRVFIHKPRPFPPKLSDSLKTYTSRKLRLRRHRKCPTTLSKSIGARRYTSSEFPYLVHFAYNLQLSRFLQWGLHIRYRKIIKTRVPVWSNHFDTILIQIRSHFDADIPPMVPPEMSPITKDPGNERIRTGQKIPGNLSS